MQVTESYYSYPFISLVAEFGGYIGLFLGVAVIQLGDISSNAAKKLAKMAPKTLKISEQKFMRIANIVGSYTKGESLGKPSKSFRLPSGQ